MLRSHALLIAIEVIAATACYSHSDAIPQPGGAPRINSWLLRGQPPQAGHAVEIVVETFTFEKVASANQGERPLNGFPTMADEAQIGRVVQ